MKTDRKYTVTPEEAIEELEEHFCSMSMCLTVEECRHHNECIHMAIDTLREYGRSTPIVRCKDCKYHGYDAEYDYWWCNRMLGGFRTEPDDFCSHGKREDNAT